MNKVLFRQLVLLCLTTILNLFLTVTSSEAQTISTIAGGGGLSEDGVPATQFRLDFPYGVAVDTAGNIFIAELNSHRVRKVTPDGIITTVAGGGTETNPGPGFSARSVVLGNPFGVAVDQTGRLYIASWGINTDRVLIVEPSGFIQRVVGTGVRGFSGDNGPANEAQLDRPNALAVDADGNLYISDSGNNRVRRVDPTGNITTYAGNGNDSYLGDGGLATQASFYTPRGLALDAEGNLYISESDAAGNHSRVRKVSPNGIITTVAGGSGSGFSGDGGLAILAELFLPQGLAVDAHDNLYIADFRNHRIRKVSRSGYITTIAGSDTFGFSGDGGPATDASLSFPSAVAVDPDGNVLIADRSNNRIRKVVDIPGIFIQSVMPPSVTLVPGDSATVTVTLGRTNYTGQISLQTSAMPAGFGSSIEHPAGGDSGTITFLTSSTTPPVTDWQVTVTANGEGISPVTVSFQITVEALDPTLQLAARV